MPGPDTTSLRLNNSYFFGPRALFSLVPWPIRPMVLKTDQAIYIGYEQSSGGDGYGSMICKLSATADKHDWCTAAPVFNVSMALTDDGTL